MIYKALESHDIEVKRANLHKAITLVRIRTDGFSARILTHLRRAIY